ncbi:MAG: TonB-dependent receptor [Pseudomonadota bacterium]|nr:TonB-dependent receptor [Pseudomonadota bacterium]
MSRGLSTSAVISLIATISLLITNSAFAIDEIVVKTRKTEESLQDVPLAITTVSAETLDRTGADGLEDITKFSPSFIFDQNSAQKDVRIAVRGLSATRGRSNVAFLVDGIDVTTEAIGTAGAGLLTSQRLLSDVQQVEAVKGPQSALFGRAAFAGAINYVTKDAPEEFEGSIGGQFAKYGDYSIDGSVGAPINDKLGWLANGYWFDDEGQYKNSISGSPLGGGEGFGGSLTLNWNPIDTLDLKARFEYIDEEYDDLPRARYISDVIDTGVNPVADINPDAEFNDNLPFVARYPRTLGDANTAITPLTRGADPRSYCIQQADGTYDDCDLSRTPTDYEGTSQELFRFSLVANWDVPALKGTLSSLTGYIDSKTHEEYDWDANAIGRPDTIPGTHDIVNDDTVEIFSQEFRYSSDLEGPLNFTLGAQVWEQERVQREFGMLSAYAQGEDFWQEDFFPFIESGGNIRNPRTVEDEHKSLYALLEWDINDQWKAAFENRYTDEKFKQERTVNIFAFNTLSVRNQDCSFTQAIQCFTNDYIDNLVLCPDPFCAVDAPLRTQLQREVDSDFITPKFTLQYMPNDDAMYYFSVAKAVKPAGLDVLGGGGPPVNSDNSPEYDISTPDGFANAVDQVLERYVGEVIFASEKMWAYEIGAKNTFDGDFGTLVLNSAFFFQDYTDKQVSVREYNPITGTTGRQTVNAGAAEVWGLELESQWFTPVDGLTVQAAWTWLPKAEYSEFDEITTSTNTAAKLDNCIPVDREGNEGPDADRCLVSRAGRDLERAPEHAVALGANYTQPLIGTNFEWFVEGNVTYQDQRYTDPEMTTYLEDYAHFDLRFGIESDQWEALVFIDNVFDDDTVLSGSEIPDFSQPLNGPAPNFITLGILPDQRQVGVRAKYNF